MKDEKGMSHVWIAPTDHRSSPHKLESTENEDSPRWLPDGELIYRARGRKEFCVQEECGRRRRKAGGGGADPGISRSVTGWKMGGGGGERQSGCGTSVSHGGVSGGGRGGGDVVPGAVRRPSRLRLTLTGYRHSAITGTSATGRSRKDPRFFIVTQEPPISPFGLGWKDRTTRPMNRAFRLQ